MIATEKLYKQILVEYLNGYTLTDFPPTVNWHEGSHSYNSWEDCFDAVFDMMEMTINDLYGFADFEAQCEDTFTKEGWEFIQSVCYSDCYPWGKAEREVANE